MSGKGDAALDFSIAEAREPGLRAWTASGRRILLTQGLRPIIAGRLHPNREDAGWARVGEAERCIRPIGAVAARSTSNSGWLQFFADELRASPDGPLHDGQWRLERITRRVTTKADPMRTETRLHTAQAGVLDAQMNLVPLRELPAVDADRVKACRRLSREQSLPPVLLWEVTGLLAHMVLDGTCRLVAAVAEGAEVDLVVLSRRDLQAERRIARWASENYEQAMVSTPDPAAASRSLGPRLAQQLGEVRVANTLARPLVGGVDAWWRAGGMAVPPDPANPPD